MFYGEGNRNWQLLEDNDPKHRSRLCTQWKNEKWYQANGMAATVSRLQSDQKCLGAPQEQADGQIIQKCEAPQCIPSMPMGVIFQKIC